MDALIGIIRRCFQDLGAFGSELHSELQVTASMRAVLERLSETEKESVPHIAQAKNVSRQHIQTIVDSLKDAGLVTLKDNPAHKRSPLVQMTKAGREIFSTMRDREGPILKYWARQLDADQLTTTLDTLQRLRELIKIEAEKIGKSKPLRSD